MRTIKSLMAAVMLMLSFGLAGNAFAQSADAKAAGYLDEILAVEYREDDLAHVSFVRMFGGFIFAPYGNAPEAVPTALAKVLGYTNVIAMILGCVIMGYVIMGGAINTAASGELLGRSWSSVWLPMRTSLAFGLIMPATDGQQVFSVAQSIVIWMVILGSNSGTWLWEKGAAELTIGAPVMSGSTFYDPAQYKGVVDVLNCAVARKNMYINMGDTSEVAEGIGHAHVKNIGDIKINIDASGITNLPDKFESLEFYDCGTIGMPSFENTSEEDRIKYADENATQSVANEVGSYMGSGTLKWEQQLVSKFHSELPVKMKVYLNASAKVVHNIQSAGFSTKALDAVLNETAEKRGTGVELIEKVELLAIEYANLQTKYADYYQSMADVVNSNTEARSTFKDMIKMGGWMRAGAWFFEASRYQGLTQTLMSQIGGVSTQDSNEGLGTICSFSMKAKDNWMTKYNPWTTAARSIGSCEEKQAKLAEHMGMLSAVEDYAKKVNIKTVEISGKGGVATPLPAFDTSGNIKPDIMKMLATSGSHVVMQQLIKLGCDNSTGGGNLTACSEMTKDTSGLTSPFTMLTAIGNGMIQLSTTMWVISLTAVGVAGAVGGSALSLGGAAGISSVAYFLVASVMGACAGFVAMGFTFAYVLPLMPVMAWIMIITGYLITVVEAVAAAPLAVIMMATPEGEGLSGANMQRAIQLINAIILKPTLAIVGLFAAMTLSYVSFSLINNLFWTVASLQNGVAIISFLAIMSIYTALCYKCVQAMIDIMHKIPNEILEWMAGGVSREFGSNISESINGMRGVGQGVGEVSGVQTGSKILNQLQREKMNRAANP